ncbi:MAG: N-glycosylase/DNA lyase [Candidatus Omnitrophica bacterium]|nr:N-glycosylase/DNA lyase [Candidatus Omnitrophota bacterium]MCM8807589.1 N-glycosylase/DNA lyase [Candidatus Omnitrophota bacterium]
MESKKIEEIRKIYKIKREEIKEKIREFQNNIKKSDIDLFAEFCFCILTPQSKALNCWEAIMKLKKENLLLNGSKEEIIRNLNKVRFKNKKAEYLIEAREKFLKDGKFKLKYMIEKIKNPLLLREYIVKNVKGMGYKEASHFLRNIGFGENLCIIDRHILKNLKEIGIIKNIPKSISKKKYFEIENKFIEFSKIIGLKPEELDLVLWAKETGLVFK